MKTAIFIDGANAAQSLNMLDKKINFNGLHTVFVGAQIRYYTATTKDNSGLNNLQKFIDWLTYHGVIVVQKEAKTLTRPNGETFIKGNMDVELVTDSLVSASFVDNYIFFTGDEDFAYLFRELRSRGKFITLVSTQDCEHGIVKGANVVASGLRKECDMFINMNDETHKQFWQPFLSNAD